MHISVPNSIDILIVCLYFAVTLLIGLVQRRRQQDSAQFLNASKALPLWVAAISFLAVNCGGLEIVGLSAMSAQYGVITLHFYLVGAIPAMIFLALFMIPVYMRSRAYSVPEFLSLRFNMQTRLLNSCCLLVASALLSGISLYAMAQTLHIFLGWEFFPSALTIGLLALAFLVAGGLRATIYNELLQLALIVAGLTPLAVYVLRDFHGIGGLLKSLPAGKAHLWQAMPLSSAAAPMDGIGVVMGLGFVLSFGYWCTDFRLMQRALTTRRDLNASLVPLIAAAGKLLFPLLVVVPGLAALSLFAWSSSGSITADNYDQALPLVIHRYYAHGLLGLGIVAILASLMSGLAGNIAAFGSVWTQELYRPYIAPARPEPHYIAVGRGAMLVGLMLSLTTAFIALRFKNLMDYIQLLFSLFNAPLLATFLLGMFTTWATPWGGFWGLLSGIAVGVIYNIAARASWIVYAGQTTTNFHAAIYAWLTAMAVTLLISAFTRKKSKLELEGVVFAWNSGKEGRFGGLNVWGLAALLGAACVWINIWLW